jgi:hypothetical protein
LQIWRVECLATPAWRDACARCGGATAHDSTGLFRVNSNGVRHDLWLLYRCRGCGDTRKRRLAQRRLACELPGGSPEPYLANDAGWARRHAFALAPAGPLSYRVWRPGPPAGGVLHARIVSPEPSGERWDRFLARELAGSRGQVARGAERGAPPRGRECAVAQRRGRAGLRVGAIGRAAPARLQPPPRSRRRATAPNASG